MRDRNYLLWVALATFFLVLLNLPSSVSSSLRGFFRESMASYQGAVTRTLSRFQRGPALAGNPEEVARDRDRLTLEVAALRLRVREQEVALRENVELRNLLGYRARLAFKTVACEVIARDDGSGWWQILRLDKGREDGILEGMPVITPEGVVGRTIEVSSQTCDVLLISDRSFKTSVRFEQDGSYGILHGGGVSLNGVHGVGVLCLPSLYRVDYVRKDLEIKTGEWVMTSGLGGVFPAGLMVGRVVRMRPDESGLYQQAEIAPAADLARLQRVLVIMSEDRR
ncbi:MAG: rod shape-determining protein MreC [bacterium]